MIPKLAKILAKPRASLKERREALKYLALFVGDIHQPLHLGYASDREGTVSLYVIEGKTLIYMRFGIRD